MKKMTILYAFLINVITFFKVNSEENDVIEFVYDFCINGTIMDVDLENVQGNYIYYYYDFNSSCLQYIKRKDNFFVVESNIDIINDQNSLNYALLEQKWDSYDEIKKMKVDDLNYNKIKFLKKEKRGDYGLNYYYKIKIDNKISTGIFRIAKNGNKKGNLWMSSLKDFSGIDINQELDDDIDDTDFDTNFIIPKLGDAIILKLNYLLLLMFLFI